MIPKRIFAYYADEPHATWWVTFNNGRTFVRGTDWVEVSGDELIMEASGFNDPEIARNFPRQQLARFQPHR